MIALIQRVRQASIDVDQQTIARINHGMLALIGIEKSDTDTQLEKLAKKLLNYRLFSDEQDKMNLNITQAQGEILLVSQFTLAANTQKGNRPGFDPAMPPAPAEVMFQRLVERVQQSHPNTQQGQFAANMQVALINDGPVTFWLQV